MALIEIYRREADGETFPEMCMKCGAEEERMVSQTLNWMPWWVNFFILLGLLPWLIAALITRKSVRLAAPMCARHVHHWRNRTIYVWGGLIFWVGVAFILLATLSEFPEDLKFPIIGICLFSSLFWLIGGLILANGAIRIAEIDRGVVSISNVNKKFAREWRMYCDEVDREPRPKKKRRSKIRREEW